MKIQSATHMVMAFAMLSATSCTNLVEGNKAKRITDPSDPALVWGLTKVDELELLSPKEGSELALAFDVSIYCKPFSKLYFWDDQFTQNPMLDSKGQVPTCKSDGKLSHRVEFKKTNSFFWKSVSIVQKDENGLEKQVFGTFKINPTITASNPAPDSLTPASPAPSNDDLGTGAVECSRSPIQQGPVSFSNYATGASVLKNEIYEIGFNLSKSYRGADRYNPSVIDISAIITRPDGQKERVYGFYKQDQSPQWAVRYSPRSVGLFEIQISAKEQSGTVSTLSEVCFEAKASSSQSFVLLDEQNPSRLKTSDQKAYVPIGVNAPGCPTQGDPTYSTVFPKMKEFNMNTVRLFSGARWGAYAIERKNPPGFSIERQCGVETVFSSEIGDYSTVAAARGDAIFKNAALNGIHIIWSLAIHEDFKYDADFATNFYTQFLPGCTPANNCEGYWVSPQAKEFVRRYMRYTYARYGAYSSFGMMELYNEADQGFLTKNADGTAMNNMFQWHEEMAAYWKNGLGDVYKHPVTTSFAWTDHYTDNDVNSWGDRYKPWESLPSLDLVSKHFYNSTDTVSDKLAQESLRSQPMGNSGKKRPFIFGEIGPNGSGIDSRDTNGRFYTDVSWVPFFFGESAGSGLRWWLEIGGATIMLPTQQYDLGYKSFGAFLKGEEAVLRTMKFTNPISIASGHLYGGYQNSDRAFVLVKDSQSNWSQVSVRNSQASFTLRGLADGVYRVEFWPTQSPNPSVISAQAINVVAGTATVTTPNFQRSLAVKIIK